MTHLLTTTCCYLIIGLLLVIGEILRGEAIGKSPETLIFAIPISIVLWPIGLLIDLAKYVENKHKNSED